MTQKVYAGQNTRITTETLIAASSLTKLWLERWLLGLWQCAYKLGFKIINS